MRLARRSSLGTSTSAPGTPPRRRACGCDRRSGCWSTFGATVTLVCEYSASRCARRTGRAQRAVAELALGGELAGPRFLRLQVRVVVHDHVADDRALVTARTPSACAPRGRPRPCSTQRVVACQASAALGETYDSLRGAKPQRSSSRWRARHRRRASARRARRDRGRQSRAKCQLSCAYSAARAWCRPVNAEKRVVGGAADPVGRVRHQRAQRSRRAARRNRRRARRPRRAVARCPAARACSSRCRLVGDAAGAAGSAAVAQRGRAHDVARVVVEAGGRFPSPTSPRVWLLIDRPCIRCSIASPRPARNRSAARCSCGPSMLIAGPAVPALPAASRR